MILTVVGCAGSVPGPDAACSCYLLEHDGFRLLLDLGTGALGPLQRFADPCAIDAVVLSHRHRDHCSDLMLLAYLRDRRGAPGRLPVIAPAGTQAHVTDPTPRDYERVLDWRDPPAAPFRLGPLTIETAPVRHSVPALAVRVTAGAASLTYSGDTGECTELLDLARGTGVLLCEAAASVETPGSGAAHLTPSQAAHLAKSAGAAHLVLTHLRPWADPMAALREARGVYGGPLSLAAPGLRVAV
ncbi:MBL fold metallo-hydrolase [Actinomadura fibrosa]|uniref:MBL fold metallo-hydrolase n=1 Tax=Actinomadura fibrosa TaxID=111802 RepID=A0ABW2XW16_9ACTN|nr:MBL fold metallo-hydrolase [Actinomadura fibrosa]